MQLIPIYSELVRPSFPRMKKVIIRSFMVELFIYMTIGAIGYFSTFNFTNSFALDREPLDNFDPDYAMLSAAALVFLVVFSAYPLFCMPWRNQFYMVTLGWKQYSQKANFILVFCYVSFTVCVSILVPNISKVLTVLGGLCVGTFAYAVPCYCWIKLSSAPWYTKFNLATIIFMGSLSCIGYVSVLATVYEMVTAKSYIGNRPDILGV